ncbi:AraC family transcriptional regulator [Bifidobacterium pullorum subsp. saeculare]|uniref:AraC family transcriptional regulator n=1 Tax=Bifidobacterium pullorum TaxID=78448 RepID=UPI0019593805|nr:AraC family transcriptional regulator [Bifidobacterium pullorum]MBM6695784.1 AraC family transcriptional regulator [Bifidobacterium pullorum subsp. saeculare]
MEEIVPFSRGQLPDGDRFDIQMTGITLPSRNYHIRRTGEPIYVIEYVISGQGHVACNGEQFSPKPGDVYILPPNTPQDYRAVPSDPFEKIWMNVSGTLCDALYREYRLGDRMLYPNRPVRRLFESFYTLCRDNKANPQFVSRRGALILHELFAAIADDPSAKQCSVQSAYAQRAKNYIDTNVQNNLKTTDIAHAVGLSASQLTRCFLSEYGMTPFNYYTSIRLNLACNLLRNSSMQVREIARTLHYADEHYFSSTFRSHVGMSPREYRKTFR